MMVRLIVKEGAGGAFIEYTFQFHDGAIDSKQIRRFIFCQIKFQFHDGAIDSKEGAGGAFIEYTFQFHDGAIDRYPNPLPLLPHYCVSIPWWCDW